MTECTTTPLPFASLGRREIHADFSAGQITSDADALLLREADQKLGLIDALNDAIPDPRNPGLITHPQRGLLAQRIFALAAGCEDLNDHQHLRDDPLWQLATEHPEVDGTDGKANPRYVVTNLEGEPQHLYEDVYCQRARPRTGSRSSS